MKHANGCPAWDVGEEAGTGDCPLCNAPSVKKILSEQVTPCSYPEAWSCERTPDGDWICGKGLRNMSEKKRQQLRDFVKGLKETPYTALAHKIHFVETPTLPCSCHVVTRVEQVENASTIHLHIEYCPKHKASSDMLEALEYANARLAAQGEWKAANATSAVIKAANTGKE